MYHKKYLSWEDHKENEQDQPGQGEIECTFVNIKGVLVAQVSCVHYPIGPILTLRQSRSIE